MQLHTNCTKYIIISLYIILKKKKIVKQRNRPISGLIRSDPVIRADFGEYMDPKITSLVSLVVVKGKVEIKSLEKEESFHPTFLNLLPLGKIAGQLGIE